MPDLSPLPPLGDAPVAPPRDFGDVLRRAGLRRRHRRVRAGSGVAATVTLAYSLGLGFGAPGAGQQLEFAATPSATPAATPAPDASGPAGGTGSGPAAGPGAGPRAPESAGTAAAPRPAAGPGRPPGGPPGASPSARPAPPVTREIVDDRPAEPCRTTDGSEPAYESAVAHSGGWCYRTIGTAGEWTGGAALTIGMELCRLPSGRDANVLHLDRETDVLITVVGEAGDGAAAQDWRIGFTANEAAERTITVETGKCVRWTMPWDTSDEYGVPLRPGRYWWYSRVHGWTADSTPGSSTGQRAWGANIYLTVR